MSEERKHIEVVAAIIKKDNTILATQRGYGDLKIGWSFQVVKVEPGVSSRGSTQKMKYMKTRS